MPLFEGGTCLPLMKQYNVSRRSFHPLRKDHTLPCHRATAGGRFRYQTGHSLKSGSILRLCYLVVPPSQSTKAHHRPQLPHCSVSPFQLQAPSSTKYTSYTSPGTKFQPTNLTNQTIPSGMDRLKVPYGAVKRRRLIWGPRSV